MTNSYSPRFRVRRLLGALGVLAAVAFVLTAATGTARAELVPCDPLFNCPPGPVYAPEQVAIGQDRDLDTAQAEAEDQADATCSAGFDVVRVRPTLLANGAWRYTLTYRCEGPPYDPWP